MPSLLLRLRRGDRTIQFVIGLWALMMIASPIVWWIVGEDALGFIVNLGVLVQAVAVMTVLAQPSGSGSAMRIALPVLAVAWLAEFVGVQTGFPFGHYSYTSALQPQVGGVPLLVPLAWLMMLPPSWAVADSILRRGARPLTLSSRVSRAALAALAFTAWDLFLDPQMTAWGLWRWPGGGIYFGIPLTNYLGWLLVSFLIGLFLIPPSLPVLPLLVIYTVTWFLSFFGQLFFWGLPGPALCGCLAMGGMLAWSLLRSRR
jgi:putative membrane protein